jgi:SAM-dependent methyltransferase
MWRWLTPSRRRGVEVLDDPATPADVRDRAMADVVRSNALFGGTRAAVSALRPLLRQARTLLDVGTGLADIPDRVRRRAHEMNTQVTTIGVDLSAPLLRTARLRLDAAICADACRLPLADSAVDVVSCSQLLHHFEDAGARRVIAELHRVARRTVVISDLRRSWFAAGGFWAAATLLRFHAITRHDGVVSVLRGFTSREIGQLVRDATGIAPTVTRHAFWRLTAVWSKSPAPPS